MNGKVLQFHVKSNRHLRLKLKAVNWYAPMLFVSLSINLLLFSLLMLK